MKILIKQAKVVDPSSAYNAQIADIFIDNGIIARIKGYAEGAAVNRAGAAVRNAVLPTYCNSEGGVYQLIVPDDVIRRSKDTGTRGGSDRTVVGDRITPDHIDGCIRSVYSA